MDRLTPKQRSGLMAAIRSTDTQPELVVRRLVHGMGYRFRLHLRDLPGTPDLVFPGRGKVLFVHGCFWHRHRCAKGRSTPATNARFWSKKFEQNVRRDRRVCRDLQRAGWSIGVVWECQTKPKRLEQLAQRLERFLEE